jgi:hypothetical protein
MKLDFALLAQGLLIAPSPRSYLSTVCGARMPSVLGITYLRCPPDLWINLWKLWIAKTLLWREAHTSPRRTRPFTVERPDSP